MSTVDLLLIDASGLAHAAHWSGNAPLTRSDGFQVGSTLRYCETLFRMLRRPPVRAERVIAVFDKGGKTWRHRYEPTYKANRKAPNPQMLQQFAAIREATKAFGYPIIEEHGVEADDIIAALVRKAKTRCTVLTADKDLLQLVNDEREIRVVRGAVDFDEAGVLHHFGVTPRQIPDWLAIVGDTADNIPGVPGVGPAGAVSLLKTYGTVEGIIAALGRIEPVSLRARVRTAEATLPRSKHLATLSPFVDVSEARPAPLDPKPPAIVRFLHEMELLDLERRVRHHFQLEEV